MAAPSRFGQQGETTRIGEILAATLSTLAKGEAGDDGLEALAPGVGIEFEDAMGRITQGTIRSIAGGMIQVVTDGDIRMDIERSQVVRILDGEDASPAMQAGNSITRRKRTAREARISRFRGQPQLGATTQGMD